MCQSSGSGSDMPLNRYVADLPDEHPAKALFGVAQIAPSRTRGSFFTAALATLRLFTNINVYNQTSASDFVLEDTGKTKRVIYIILPDEKTTFYPLAALFVYQHYVALVGAADARGGRLSRRVNFLLDEFGNFTEIPSFEAVLTVAGGRGMRFNLFVQSVAQIEVKYGRERTQTVLDNCHCWIYLKTTNHETAKRFSEKLGQYTTSSYSKSSSFSMSGRPGSSENRSMNLIARALLTDEEVARINAPYALVTYAGHHPAITYLPDLSQQLFNVAMGLGDETFNTALRLERAQQRESMPVKSLYLWGIWNLYQRQYGG
jgi:type IV secretion system protein VirD4